MEGQEREPERVSQSQMWMEFFAAWQGFFSQSKWESPKSAGLEGADGESCGNNPDPD